MSNSQPSPISSEPDVLALTGSAYHSPGLHFVDLTVGSRYGFSTDQAETILDAPALLSQLQRIWRNYPPTPTVTSLAQMGDSNGAAHLELLRRTGHFTPLRTRTEYALTASTGRAAEVLIDRLPEAGISITRRVFKDEGFVDIDIESTKIPADEGFPVIGLLAVGADQSSTTRLLFLLTSSSADSTRSRSESRFAIDKTLISDRLGLYHTPVDATVLTGTDLAAVSRSVGAAKLLWKNAWRRAALATVEGSPLRDAVIQGLSMT